jgi:hypothetical protein
MPISTDTSIVFNYADNAAAIAAGYTLFQSSNLSWSGTAVSLTGTSAIEAAIRTPMLDTSAWGNIVGIFVAQTDAVNYLHRYLISFSDWSTGGLKYYSKFVGGEWLTIADSTLSAVAITDACRNGGMTRSQLALVRKWPAVGTGTRLSILVSMERNTGGGTGALTQATVSYGSEVLAYPGITASGQTLPYEPDMQSVRTSPEQYAGEVKFEDYRQTIERATALRHTYQLTWNAFNLITATQLENFLKLYRQNTSFTWRPRGWAASSQWVVLGDITRRELGRSGLYRISATIEQALA